MSTVKASSTVTVSADVHVVSSTPTTNYGTENGLSVFNDYEEYGNAYTWLKFQIPSTPYIKTAKLYLKQDELLTGNPPVSIHLGSNDWTETGITWNNQPSCGSAFDSVQITEVETWYSWTVTSQISAGETISFVLKTSTSSAIAQFYSKEWGYAGETAKPYLEITYGTGNGNNVNFMDLPQRLSEAIGIPVFASQLLICTILLFASQLPCAIWAKSSLVSIIVGFSVMGILVAFQWLPYWFLLLISLIVALIYAKELKGSVSGESP